MLRGKKPATYIMLFSARIVKPFAMIKASVSVNREMLLFYWSLGRDIVEKDAENTWSFRFYHVLSVDLQKISERKGVS